MFTLTRILAPVDLSEASDAALQRAADLAARTDAELHVLHVVPGVSPDVAYHELSENDRALLETLLAEAEEHLSQRCEAIRTRGIRIKRVLSKGAPSRVLLDYAEREGIDLIVMGTHGRRGMRRLFLGSVAEEVLRRTSTPTLVVPMNAGTSPIRHVFAPTDFSDVAGLALPVAAGFAAMYRAALTLVHVIEPVPYVDAIAGAEFTLRMMPELRTNAEERLEQLAGDGGLADSYSNDFDEPVEGSSAAMTRIGQCVLSGRAAEAIVKAAEDGSGDAIVMAKHGLHGVERFLIGSVTERVCRLAPCSVLVLPIDAHEQ